jgi:hypothetical protein
MSRWKLLFILLLVLVILACKFLPWYVLVGLAVLFVLSAKFIGKKLLLWLFTLPFRAKGAVLHHATATVHSLERVPAPPPVPAQADEEESPQDMQQKEPRDYYRLNVTISPKPSAGPFHLWEIGELRLVHPDYRVMADGQEEEAELCEIEQWEVQVNELFIASDDDENEPVADSQTRKTHEVGEFIPDQGYKLPGPQRLRLLLAIKPGTRRLVFQYYFEKFGEIVIPMEQLPNRDGSRPEPMESR